VLLSYCTLLGASWAAISLQIDFLSIRILLPSPGPAYLIGWVPQLAARYGVLGLVSTYLGPPCFFSWQERTETDALPPPPSPSFPLPVLLNKPPHGDLRRTVYSVRSTSIGTWYSWMVRLLRRVEMSGVAVPSTYMYMTTPPSGLTTLISFGEMRGRSFFCSSCLSCSGHSFFTQR
jgi:hypothetical protein